MTRQGASPAVIKPLGCRKPRSAGRKAGLGGWLFQRKFQGVIGDYNEKVFDKNNRLYFTREVYDLFAPTYGDTCPSFNEAIGMTYEQSGAGRPALRPHRWRGDTYYALGRNPLGYKFLPQGGWNVGVIKKNSYAAGFTGKQAQLVDTFVLGAQDLGRGQVVYLGDNPLFRAFWQSGKLLFGNAVFWVGQ